MDTKEIALLCRVSVEKVLEAIYEQASGDGETALRYLEATLDGLKARNNGEISTMIGISEQTP